jgi:hypothetical protein
VDLKPNSSRAELMEWLGLKPADLLVYLSLGAVVAIYFIEDSLWDAFLSGVGILAALVACPIGMKRDPNVSEFTNIVKLVSYIPIAILAILAVALHYVYFR